MTEDDADDADADAVDVDGGTIKMVDDCVCRILRQRHDEIPHRWLQLEPYTYVYQHGHMTNMFYYPMLCCG